jgi:hypothetical protein
VLPVRFGTVLPSEAALRENVLDRHEDELLGQLEQLAGHVELSVRVTYDEQGVLSEIVRANPEIARLHQATAGRDPEAVHAQRVQLGELVDDALEERRGADRERVLARLTPHAADVRPDLPIGEYGVVSAAFLVPETDLQRFDGAVETAGGDLGPLLRFRYVGPLVPYSFAELGLDD